MFRTRTRTDGPTAVFFIRSASVDAYLVLKGSGVAYAAHAELPYQKELDLERYRKSMAAALLECSMKLSTEGLAPLSAKGGYGPLAGVTCILSAPWHQPLIEMVPIEAPEPFEVTERALKHAAEERIKSQGASLAEALGGEIAIVGKRLARFWINGYATTAPYGLVGSSVCVQVQCAAVGVDVRNSINEVIEKVLNQDAIDIETSMGLLARAMPALDDEGRFAVVEAHGEITEVTLIEEGGVAGRTAIPVGTHSIVRTLQKLTRMTPPEAESAIIMKEKRKPLKTAETEAIAEASGAWCKGVAAALNELSTNAPAPSAVAVAADANWLPWFADAIAASDAVASEIGIRPSVYRAAEKLAGHPAAGASAHADYAPLLALVAVDSGRSA